MNADDVDLPIPQPQGDYVPVSSCGDLLFTAGMTPRVQGEVMVRGRLGHTLELDKGREGATIAARNALGALVSDGVSLESIDSLVRMTVYINATDAFDQHSAVADAGTKACVEILGSRGRCARTAIGVSSLPGGACVEIELIARVRR